VIDWRRWAGPGVVILAAAAGLAMLEVSGQAFWQGLAITHRLSSGSQAGNAIHFLIRHRAMAQRFRI